MKMPMKKPMAPGSKIGEAKTVAKSQGFTMDTKVAASTGKGMGKQPSQKITGKLAGMTTMGNGSSVGQGVKTVKSNPIQGAKNEQAGNTQMGNGGVINPFV